MSAKLLNKKRERAARMVAEDRYPDNKIAESCGIAERTLERWKSEPAFAARVQEIVSAYATRAINAGLARRERRLTVLNDVHDRLLTIIDERAQDPGLSQAPGGKTGLITKQLKGIGKGEDFRITEVFELDAPLVREIRAIHEQVAKETGQWSEKRELKIRSLKDLSDEELEQLADELTNEKTGA